MRKFLEEPLLHFVLLGALIFAGYAWLNHGQDTTTGQILVSRGQIENLRLSYSRVWQRQPTPAEMDGLIQDHVREEVLAREAVKLGLDRDDTVIRRRLRQKMEFVASDLAVPAQPTDAELESFLEKHPDLFRIEPRLSFRQVYLNPEQRGASLQRDAARMLAGLNRPGATQDFRALGDPTMLRTELADVSSSEVASEFGEAFARQVEQMPVGRWQGPVTSGYGDHVVLVTERTPGRTPALKEVRAVVAREWADARRREENEKFYRELLKHYTVTIEREPSTAPGNAVAAEVR